MKNNRTANTTRNIIFGLISRIVNLILPFIIRTIILRKLGAEYTGLGSLFTSILQVLSVADFHLQLYLVYINLLQRMTQMRYVHYYYYIKEFIKLWEVLYLEQAFYYCHF